MGLVHQPDDEGSITAVEYKEALQNRNLYLAGVKQRQDEYNAERATNNAQTVAAQLASIRQMSRQVWRGSAGEYQAEIGRAHV